MSTTWTREMAVELAREEYERGLAEGRAEAAAEIAQAIEADWDINEDERDAAARIARQYAQKAIREDEGHGREPVPR